MIKFGTLGKTFRKHTKKQTEGELRQSVMKRKIFLKNYQLMTESRN